jgi:FkbM family methyltransferase
MDTGYLHLRTDGAREALVLYRALFRAGLARLVRDRSYRSPGQFLRRPITVQANGGWMQLRARTDDVFYALPNHKLSVAKWFHPRPGELVVDVGAHIGYFALAAGRAGARVLALEGNPANFEILAANIERNGLTNVTAIEAALGTGGPATMAVIEGLFGMSSTRPDWVPPHGDGSGPAIQRIPVVTQLLDSVLEAVAAERIDWMLIDVEGSEVDVLRGAVRALRRTERLILEVFQSPESPVLETLLHEGGLEVIARERQTDRTEYWLARRRRPTD